MEGDGGREGGDYQFLSSLMLSGIAHIGSESLKVRLVRYTCQDLTGLRLSGAT